MVQHTKPVKTLVCGPPYRRPHYAVQSVSQSACLSVYLSRACPITRVRKVLENPKMTRTLPTLWVTREQDSRPKVTGQGQQLTEEWVFRYIASIKRSNFSWSCCASDSINRRRLWSGPLVTCRVVLRQYKRRQCVVVDNSRITRSVVIHSQHPLSVRSSLARETLIISCVLRLAM